MEDLWIWIVLGFIVLTAGGYFTIRKDGKIQDRHLTVDLFLKELADFSMSLNEKRKQGFTEKDVQNELEIFFKKRIDTVFREYALEGANSKKIDFDLGNGKIGVEVKLAREAIKEAGWDRALGQLVKYANRKYNARNLIVLVAGTKDEIENQKLKEFKKDIEEFNCVCQYITIG